MVMDWSSPEGPPAAEPFYSLLPLIQGRPRYLLFEEAFDRCLAPLPFTGSVLRLSDTPAALLGRESDFALLALAAPGTLRTYGARRAEDGRLLCRIDFDSPEAIRHFMTSALREAWSAHAATTEQTECWLTSLPSLSYWALAAEEPLLLQAPQADESLSVFLSTSADGRRARLRLHGCVDAHNSAHCERMCRTLINSGCEQVEIDVSGLTTISLPTLQLLSSTARRIKERGGRFILVDNETRVKRVTRAKQLEFSTR